MKGPRQEVCRGLQVPNSQYRYREHQLPAASFSGLISTTTVVAVAVALVLKYPYEQKPSLAETVLFSE